ILRLLVVSEAQEDGLPQQTILRDLFIPHIAHELRLDPRVIRTLGQLAAGRWLACRRLANESLQLGTDFIELVTRESRPRSAAVNELAVLVCADMQRAETGARAFSLGETNDDKIIDAIGANLEPIAGSTAAIWTVGLLGHDALQSQLYDLLVQPFTVLLEVLGVAQRPHFGQPVARDFLALDPRPLPQAIPAEREEIEHVEGRRRLDRGPLRFARAEFGPGLQHVEARFSNLVQYDQLTVEDDALEWNRFDGARDFGK